MPTRGHLALPVILFGCYNSGCGSAAGTSGVEAREATEHPTVYNAAPLSPGESYPSLNSQRLRLRNPGPMYNFRVETGNLN